MIKETKFANVWDALEPSADEAANMKVRSNLMAAIRKIVDGWDETQSAAAKRLRISQPRLNDLLSGRIDKFSVDSLVNLAAYAGLRVELKIRRAA